MSLTNKETKVTKERTVKYKIRMIIDIDGEIDGQAPLSEDTGIYPFIQWAMEDIENKLGCTCDIVDVKKVELEEID